MPALTSHQRAMVMQFVQATGASEKTAQKFLKTASYKLDVAADAYVSAVVIGTMCLGGLLCSLSSKSRRKSQTPSISSASTDKVGSPSCNKHRQDHDDNNNVKPKSPSVSTILLTVNHASPSARPSTSTLPSAAPPATLPASEPIDPQESFQLPHDTGSSSMYPRGSGFRQKLTLASSIRAATSKGAGGYFNTGPVTSGGPSAGSNDNKLGKMFDDLRDPSQDAKDSLGVDSTMNYLSSLGLNPASGEIFVALELVQAPSIGEMTRKGFVDGWKEAGASSSQNAHKQLIRHRVSQLSSDPQYFKRVYRYAFLIGKDADQRALGLETAIEFWKVLFSPPGRPWKTTSYDWLDLWIEFLAEKWTRSVNRDMWNQALEFANKTADDETLGFWSEDSAWPSVIDDFVMWCREKKGIGKKDAMEMDD